MVKANWTVIDPEGLPSAVERALQVARTPPYGPVHLAVYDTMLGKQQITADIIEGSKSGLRSGNASDEDLVRVLSVLDESKKPMIYAGDGIWKSGGEKLAAQLATHFGAAVANSHTDYRGISIKHPQHIGQFDQASAAYEPDFILSIGARHQGSGYSSDHIPFKRLSNTGGTHIALGSDLEYVTNYPGLDLAIIGDEKNALERLLSVAMDDFPSTRYNLKREKALEAGTLWRSARRKSMRPDLENGVVRPGVVADVVDAELEAIGGGFVTNEQFAAKTKPIANIIGSTPKVSARLTAIGVKRTAHALLLIIFVKKATRKKKADKTTAGLLVPNN